MENPYLNKGLENVFAELQLVTVGRMWGLCIGALVIISITHFVYRWRNPRCNGKLPPGSMGFPLLGETLQFFTPNTSSDIPPFIKKRMDRYGPIFKTNLVGRPVVISTDPDLNYFIFQQEGVLFQSWYPDTFTEIFGRQNVGSLHGFLYKYLKNMVLNLFGPESLKKMLPEVEQAANRTLQKWSCQDTIELKDATASMIFDLTAKKLISYEPDKSSENLRTNFVAFIRGLISFPLNIPGTAYHKCLQGRKRAMRILKTMLQERRAMPRKQQSDFFDYVLEELRKDGTILTEAIALDLMFVLLFASFETTSLAITLAIKFLSDHPLVLKQLTEEHEAILNQRENADSGLTWKEYKSMTFTFQFINETVRLANIVPGIFRKALRDIQFKGMHTFTLYRTSQLLITVINAKKVKPNMTNNTNIDAGHTIPASWGVMVCPPAVHLNPVKYKDPLAFDPSRWEITCLNFLYLDCMNNAGIQGVELNGATKHFMAFGGGIRFCVGTEFTKAQMAVFLHCLVTKYRKILGNNKQHIALHKQNRAITMLAICVARNTTPGVPTCLQTQQDHWSQAAQDIGQQDILSAEEGEQL
ncbi:cytochrome p450 708a2 [Quercus suber]|uniref:Cytochrome p450 708a2 n=1 Tax=Quercus suber TaxID=58331 RepID=A0AAW0IJN4_QUESU